MNEPNGVDSRSKPTPPASGPPDGVHPRRLHAHLERDHLAHERAEVRPALVLHDPVGAVLADRDGARRTERRAALHADPQRRRRRRLRGIGLVEVRRDRQVLAGAQDRDGGDVATAAERRVAVLPEGGERERAVARAGVRAISSLFRRPEKSDSGNKETQRCAHHVVDSLSVPHGRRLHRGKADVPEIVILFGLARRMARKSRKYHYFASRTRWQSPAASFRPGQAR